MINTNTTEADWHDFWYNEDKDDTEEQRDNVAHPESASVV